LIGYQLVRNAVTYAAYAGVDLQSIKLTPGDPANPVRGQGVGAKFIVEIETDEEKTYYADLAGEYSTAFDTYWARAGAKFGSSAPATQIAIGPEGTVIGDQSLNAQRLGAFLLVPLQLDRYLKVEVIAAGGYQWVQGRIPGSAPSTAGESGGYATISFSVPF